MPSEDSAQKLPALRIKSLSELKVPRVKIVTKDDYKRVINEIEPLLTQALLLHIHSEGRVSVDDVHGVFGNFFKSIRPIQERAEAIREQLGAKKPPPITERPGYHPEARGRIDAAFEKALKGGSIDAIQLYKALIAQKHKVTFAGVINRLRVLKQKAGKKAARLVIKTGGRDNLTPRIKKPKQDTLWGITTQVERGYAALGLPKRRLWTNRKMR